MEICCIGPAVKLVVQLNKYIIEFVYSVKGVVYACVGFVVKPCVYKRLGWDSFRERERILE